MKCFCKLLADDTKIYKPIETVQDQILLQKDLFSVCDGSDYWLLRFNIQKCKYIQFGNVKFEYDYEIRDSKGNIRPLQRDTQEKDLGVLFSEKS